MFQKPRVVTLDALSKAAAAAAPRGPSKQHCCPADAQHGAHQHQHRPAGSVLDILQGRSGQVSAASSDRPSSRKWHRRASSVPDTPPILEADREGIDTGSFTAVHPAAAAGSSTDGGSTDGSSQQQERLAPVPAEVPLPFGMRPAGSAASTAGSCMEEDFDDTDEEDGAVWMDVCCSDTAAALQADAPQHKGTPSGPEGLRSLSGRMPIWLWPSSRLAVRDVTTDELMRRISSSRDVSALQHMARGLLCERNDWRFKATQVRRRECGCVGVRWGRCKWTHLARVAAGHVLSETALRWHLMTEQQSVLMQTTPRPTLTAVCCLSYLCCRLSAQTQACKGSFTSCALHRQQHSRLNQGSSCTSWLRQSCSWHRQT